MKTITLISVSFFIGFCTGGYLYFYEGEKAGYSAAASFFEEKLRDDLIRALTDDNFREARTGF